MESVIAATGRQISGSAGARRLRRSGQLPGVVNTENGQSHLIQMDKHGFQMMLHHHASENVIIDLSIDGGKAKKVLVKNVQHDTLSGDVLHVDLMEDADHGTVAVGRRIPWGGGGRCSRASPA